MKKTLMAMGLAITLALPISVQAQGGPGGPGGGFRRSPKGKLSMVLRGIGDLEKGGKAPLTKDQAKKIVTAVTPWKAKPAMTDDQAKTLFMQINGVLTTKQKNELDKMAAQQRRTGGGGDGGGRMGGGGGAGGPGGGAGGGQPPSEAEMQKFRAQMQKMQGFFKTSNPFYPPSKYKEFKDMPERMQTSNTKRYQSRMALLAQLSKKANGK